jgi:lipid-A-disaccharide synthase
LRVAEEMHRRGVPVFYYVAPQFWAWRQWRVKKIRRWIRNALCIFPFEEQWYRERGVDAEFVGHPLADLESPKVTREQFARENGLDPDKPWIALLPGSRRKEVRMHLPTLLQAAALIESQAEFLLPVASTLDSNWITRFLAGSKLKITLVSDARAALFHARAAAVASGTATVEAALMGCPFVMVYRVSTLSYALGRPLVQLPRFAMVNLIAGREVVPELVQSRFTPKNVAAKLRELISDSSAREKMKRDFADIRVRLKGEAGAAPAAERAADSMLRSLALQPAPARTV